MVVSGRGHAGGLVPFSDLIDQLLPCSKWAVGVKKILINQLLPGSKWVVGVKKILTEKEMSGQNKYNWVDRYFEIGFRGP